MSDPRRIFSTLEVIMEHAQSAFLVCGQQAGHTPHEHRAATFGMETPEYHLLAVEEACSALYQQLVKALPGAAALDEGEVAPGILDAIDAPPVEQWNLGLPGGPSGPFFSVISSTGRVIALQVPDRSVAERILKLPQLERGNRDA